MLTRNELYKERRHAWAQVGINFEPQFFCTMIFNKDISLAEACDYLKKFHQRIDRNLLGQSYYKKDISMRTAFIAFPERGKKGKREFLHFHLLLKLDDSNPQQYLRNYLKLCTRANRIWRKLYPTGNFRVSPLEDQSDILKTCLYSTKDIFEDTNENNIIFSDSFVKGS